MAASVIAEHFSQSRVLALPCGADLSAAKGLILKWHSTQGQVAIAAADAGTELICGIAQTNATSAATDGTAFIDVYIIGDIVEVLCNGATDIAIGDTVGCNASGVGIKTTTDGDQFIGRALMAHTADASVRIPIQVGGPVWRSA